MVLTESQPIFSCDQYVQGWTTVRLPFR